jgi:hypothetical protein
LTPTEVLKPSEKEKIGTDHIDRFLTNGILLKSGGQLAADIISQQLDLI